MCVLVVSATQTQTHSHRHRETPIHRHDSSNETPTQTSTTPLKSCGISLTSKLPLILHLVSHDKWSREKKKLKLLPESPRRPFPGKLASELRPGLRKTVLRKRGPRRRSLGKLTTSRLPFPSPISCASAHVLLLLLSIFDHKCSRFRL